MICRLPETTVGIERIINRPLRSRSDATQFVEGLLRDQPDAPPYFGRVKKANECGPELHDAVPVPPRMVSAEFASAARELHRVVVDTREWGAWMDGHLAGSIFAMLDQYFGPTVANYLEADDEVLLVCDSEDIDEAVRVLYRVGIDRFAGWITPRDFGAIDEDEFQVTGCEEISPREANRRICTSASSVLDVRSRQEFRAGHVKGAVNIPFTQLPARVSELDPSRPLVVYCRAGNRSARACAYLCRRGFAVANLCGGYWPYAGRGF
jgi:hydroxyacylglutathione hydrolase